MEASLKVIFLLGLITCSGIAVLEKVDGAGPCGKSSPDNEAMKLAPCAAAAQDEKSAWLLPSSEENRPEPCLCAVMLSDTAKSSGIKPEVAMTIPKRCNIADRPVGYKCGHSNDASNPEYSCWDSGDLVDDMIIMTVLVSGLSLSSGKVYVETWQLKDKMVERVEEYKVTVLI
ncbi:LOW QUALITY PROTEIN: hypothetical protein RJ639_031969 [Escallonia herrerae]|uniref:Bifunctional inhibitor/plant lipid transfer protein/seed storage helical domain-containing protein n=1 Tax=Escallonia herrerae TaxID=1293975 RepID=A0AA88XF59_9ASTE|nr:LOW QUALITY PROTEIN: hypothetical protein RJ639_031969 [Escallonia herrerae]